MSYGLVMVISFRPVHRCLLPLAAAQISLARRRSSSLGSSPAVASRSSSRALRPLLDTCVGTSTWTVTSRSPVVPSLRRTPLPRTRDTRPFGVPGGIRTVTGAPRCVGTLISAPRASSVIVTGTVTVRLSADRPKTGCGRTCTRTYRSPAGPPRSPGAPLPRSLIRWPSATPAGMRAWMVRVLGARPLPLQDAHGSSTTRPRPRQVRHGSETEKLPMLRSDIPVPWQVGQTLGTVPALAPVPWHTGHGPSPVSRSGTVVPSMASLNESVVSVSTSAPRRGLVCGPPRPPPNMPPSRSPSRPPDSPVPPNRSPRSKPPKPPAPVPVPAPVRPPAPGTRNPPPKSERASSYSFRFFSSERMLYASEISLNRSSADRSPLFASGWYLRASLRYDCLISSVVAVLETPRTL